MSDKERETLWVCIAAAVVGIAFCVMITVIGLYSSANGRDAKVACVTHGGTWTRGDCLHIGGGGR